MILSAHRRFGLCPPKESLLLIVHLPSLCPINLEKKNRWERWTNVKTVELSPWIYRVATGAIARARHGRWSMPGNPSILRHLGPTGFFLLSSNLNDKLQHRRSRREAEAGVSKDSRLPSPAPPMERQPMSQKIPIWEKFSLGQTYYWENYHGLNSEQTDQSDVVPAFGSPLFGAGMGAGQTREGPTITRNTETKSSGPLRGQEGSEEERVPPPPGGGA